MSDNNLKDDTNNEAEILFKKIPNKKEMNCTETESKTLFKKVPNKIDLETEAKNLFKQVSNKGEITNTETDAKILFKKVPRKHLRERFASSEDSDSNTEYKESSGPTKLEELKLRQKLRKRQRGVSLPSLAGGKKLPAREEVPVHRSAGLINLQSIKTKKNKEPDDAYDVGIGTQFSAETNKRDEDEEMMKYIEVQLNKRKGGLNKDDEHNQGNDTENKYLTPEEAALYSLPEYLRSSSSKNSEEMLSNQMLNGIPEVDLGIDAKIKNIEATEDAKQKLLQDQKNKKDGPSQFVPTNMAVNFMQHNRFNIEENNDSRKRKQIENRDKRKDNPTGTKKATDDYHYDKFRKQYRRH